MVTLSNRMERKGRRSRDRDMGSKNNLLHHAQYIQETD
jgi:hypothetical protein